MTSGGESDDLDAVSTLSGHLRDFALILPGWRVWDLDRDGIPARVMVTGGHPRWEGRGVSSPIQDAMALG